MPSLKSLLCVLLVCPVCSPKARAAQSDSLRAQFYSSVSLRNPTIKTRLEERPGGLVDTVNNGFDYELAAGIAGTYATIAFKMDYQYERQNGLHYVNQEYELRHRATAYEVGVRLRDDEEDKLYLLSGYVEMRLFGWVGVGVTQQYLSQWFKEGGTLARFSLARNEYHFARLSLFVRAEYETAPSRNRIFFYTEVKNFKRGRFALVPLYRLERVKPATGPAVSSYQGKIKLTIDI